MSTILTPCFKGLAVFRDFIAPTPAGDHGGYPHYIGVFGGFEAVLAWKLDGFKASLVNRLRRHQFFGFLHSRNLLPSFYMKDIGRSSAGAQDYRSLQKGAKI